MSQETTGKDEEKTTLQGSGDQKYKFDFHMNNNGQNSPSKLTPLMKKDPSKEDEDEENEEVEEHDPYFEPVITLPLVETKTLEEDEEVVWSARARLYRFEDNPDPAFSTEGLWKEKGTGQIKILKHPETGSVRIVMRRDATLKLCANHFIYPSMELKEHPRSHHSWVWATQADSSDPSEPDAQILAVRFKTEEISEEFRLRFNEAKAAMKEREKKVGDHPSPPMSSSDEEDSDDVEVITEQLAKATTEEDAKKD